MEGMLSLASDDVPATLFTQLKQKFTSMMRRLHIIQQGANLAISMLDEPETQDFISTHAAVLDSSFTKAPMSDAMRQSLEKSDYVFSGIKTFHELNEAIPSLIDENGNRKTFEQFLNDVRSIDEKYNRNYLRAEYNYCQQSANMASKWEQFQKDYEEYGDRYYLQYRTAGDDHVRPAHAALNRITLPVPHPFWKRYFPPNGWNCRCTVVQVRASRYPVTPDSEVEHLISQNDSDNPKEAMFHVNPGMEKKTFPDYNAYTIRRCQECPVAKGKVNLAFIPSNQLCQGCQIIHQCYGDLQKSENAVTKKHYLTEMEPLKQTRVTVNGNGHSIKVGFNQKGNKHLYADAYKGKIDKEELLSLDKMLQNATFVTKAGLSKPRPNDDIKRFYYYRTVNRNGQEIFLNVAETDHRKSNGEWFHKRFLYSITRSIKE